MLTLTQLLALSLCYTLSIVLIVYLSYRDSREQRFSFHLLFTFIYLSTFYLGYPFSLLLSYQFNAPLLHFDILFSTLIAAISFYILYYVTYRICLMPKSNREQQIGSYNPIVQSNSIAKITAIFLLFVAIITIAIFFLANGLLLFKLDSYNQIFSQQVEGVALKRFFYFFMPALLIFYFLYQTKKAWWLFLILATTFGLLSYVLVGGTRANIALAIALFVFIGLAQGYISLRTLCIIGLLGIIGMFSLAMLRYDLNVSGREAFYTFLYLTRDTFSPWENVALILKNYYKIDYQGLAPIMRDFYVFIPKSIWPERPDLILNTANYFTWQVLNYFGGLTISPTLLGSFLIMGGVPMLLLGSIFVGLIIKIFDSLYYFAKNTTNNKGAVIKAYCFANIFNLIILVREGLDAFVSKFVFFTLIFAVCCLLATAVVSLFRLSGFVKIKPYFYNG